MNLACERCGHDFRSEPRSLRRELLHFPPEPEDQLPLRGRDKSLAVDLMFETLSSRSALQRVFALQALANYAQNDAALRKRVQPILQQALTDSSAAIRARARKLILQLKQSSHKE